MTGREQLSMGRKADSIYTAMKKNAASKACYVYINGIMMPVLSA